MDSKVVMSDLAVILLITAIVGVAAEVPQPFPVTSTANNNAISSTTTTSKSVETICSPTVHLESCKHALGKRLKGSDNPKDIIHVAVNATIDKVRMAVEHSDNLSSTINDPVNKMAMKECKRLFHDAINDLHAVLHVAHDPQGLLARSDDIKTWLNGVISYQTACMENFVDIDLKVAVEEAVTSVVELASNALALFKEYGFISKELAVDLDKLAVHRRHLSHEHLPSWFSASDRSLIHAATDPKPKPHVVVAQDGTGDYNTINAALAAMPGRYHGRYIIYVKAGLYNEHVVIDSTKPNVYMYGDGPRRSVVTGSRSYADKYTTSESATFVVLANGFIAKSMGFTNTAGPKKYQAVALRVQGDMASFFNCRVEAYQDTLYAQSNRQFYGRCVISGTVDFIFGDSFTLLQNCILVLRRPMESQQNIVTAQGRADAKEDTAIVIQNCKIVPDKHLFPDRFKVLSYLGRPWKSYAQTVIMETNIGDVITPAGYMAWPGNSVETPFYGEYANTGPGAVTTGRVKWPGVRVLSQQEAQKYTAATLLDNNSTWLEYTGGQYTLGFKR